MRSYNVVVFKLEFEMKTDIHPQYKSLNVHCSGCSTDWVIMSTLKKDSLDVEFCSNCHGAYTGKRKISSKGKVDKFNQKFGQFTTKIGKKKTN